MMNDYLLFILLFDSRMHFIYQSYYLTIGYYYNYDLIIANKKGNHFANLLVTQQSLSI